MAFVKPKKLGIFTCSSVLDPVVKVEDKEDFITNYAKSGFNKSMLNCEDGQEPTEFICEPLKSREVASLPSVHDGNELFFDCFKLGVKEIRNP